jgi:tetratricopeptide (TPR) repeat protein
MSMASIGKAMVLIGLKHYAEAEAVLQQTLEKKPEATFIHSYLALTQYYQNNLKQAQVTIAKGLKSDDNRLFSHTIQAMIFAKADKLDQALGELELNVIPYLHDDPSLSVAVSAVYALLNRPGLSVQWLERAFQYGYKQVPWLESDPNFNAIRKDERFITLLKTARKDWEKQTNAGSSN